MMTHEELRKWCNGEMRALAGSPMYERGAGVFTRTGHVNGTTASARKALLREKVEPMLERELQHREIVPEGGSYAAKLIGWVEVSGGTA